MAASTNLVRSVGSRLLACNRFARDCRVTGLNLHRNIIPPTVLAIARQQHSDAQIATPATETASLPTASEAEKTPVVINNDAILKLLENMKENMPVSDMADPYQKEHPRCILCKYDLDVNYKNVQLLSQFVSPYTGRIYGRAVTGLCIPMQKRVATAIKQARTAGYMPYILKQSEYLKDPRLFDPFKQAK